VVGDAAESLNSTPSHQTVALGGGMAANPRFNTELRRLVGRQLLRAVVPEPVGRALGAALSATGGGPSSSRMVRGSQPATARPLPDLALGPMFTDHDIKRTLDNCRLDYVYEPDWPRLLGRVSVMLSQGKVVAWFQGAMAFGPRVLGSRSVLCDPAGRYARLNVNEYFRHVPLDEPLPVVFAPSAAAACLASSVVSPPGVVDAAVKDEWRDRLAAALDWRKQVRVQAVGSDQAPELCDLLERHFERTGVPALIETTLGRADEPPACTPRDAVRTVYSSAIDALVIGRFLLMKDYWLLRSDGA
jgi:carbamoyltransferase